MGYQEVLLQVIPAGLIRRMEGGEAPKKVKKERMFWKRRLEDQEPRLPALPPSSKEASYKASEVAAESWISVTETLRQVQISKATAALIVDAEELQERPRKIDRNVQHTSCR